MAQTLIVERSKLSGLPHWETLPADTSAAIVEIKAAIRERIAASGRRSRTSSPRSRFLRAEVADIQATRKRGEEVWPIIDYADIEAGTVSSEALAQVKRRCVVVRGHPRDLAEQWDRDIVEYVDSNHFFESYAGPADDFFGDLASKPRSIPSTGHVRMEARQHPRMAAAQSFLNAQWISETDGHRWFDPDRDSLYPDRIRRRPPGVDSAGLGTHMDPGTLDLWMTEGYQQHFRHLFSGDFAA